MKKGKELKVLTKAELQVMQLLWRKDKAFVNELIEEIPEPKPAYNTVSTIVRILEKKGFIGHDSFGKSHQYYPLVERETYLNGYVGNMLSSFFSGSVSNMVSFLSKKEEITLKEADEILEILKKSRP